MKLEEYKIRLQNAKQAINNADYILIGAGAGLSTSAGLEYSGESFQKNYKEFIEKYHFEDIRFPFEQMPYQHIKTTLIRMNTDYPMARQEIKNKTISFDENINQILKGLYV